MERVYMEVRCKLTSSLNWISYLAVRFAIYLLCLDSYMCGIGMKYGGWIFVLYVCVTPWTVMHLWHYEKQRSRDILLWVCQKSIDHKVKIRYICPLVQLKSREALRHLHGGRDIYIQLLPTSPLNLWTPSLLGSNICHKPVCVVTTLLDATVDEEDWEGSRVPSTDKEHSFHYCLVGIDNIFV